MLKIIQGRVAASTLPEVLISIIIIMAVFTISITIYIRITSSGISIADRQIQGEMTRIISRSIEESDWEEKTVNLDSVSYQKTASPYHDYKDLIILQVTAERNNEVLGKMRRVINRKNEGKLRTIY